MRAKLWVAILLFPLVARPDGAESPLHYPETKVVPVTDTYFGTQVTDRFRWLENPDDPSVKAWAAAQTKVALDFIHGVSGFAALEKRIDALSQTPPYRGGLIIRGGHLFYGRETPPEAQVELMVMDHMGAPERVLFDPVKAKVKGVTPAIGTVEISNDGRMVAFTSELGGSEDETLHVIDVASGKMLADTLPHVGGGESPVAVVWDADDKGFDHTLWPKNPDGSYAKAGIAIYHHLLETDPAADTYVFGQELSPKSEHHLARSIDGSVEADVVNDGDGVHSTVYLRKGTEAFAAVATPEAGIAGTADLGGGFVGDEFYAIAKKRNSLGEVVALAPGGSFETARVVVPASSVVISSVKETKDGFITTDIDAGDYAGRLFDASGKLILELPVPKISHATIAVDPKGGPIVISYHNYTTDTTWMVYDPATGKTSTIDFPHATLPKIAVEKVFVPSLDGKVRIPLEILYDKEIKHGHTSPTILNAYGAYGMITSPGFDPVVFAWLERGGVMAHAMVRGGGEYGDDWHNAGRHETKTNSSDDLAACALWLGKNGYGDKEHLGIEGGSAGGFLMGLALTRNPELYRAVVAEVGILDLLRFELTPNGAYNTPEFGTVKDPVQFAWMLKQSPYANVRAGTAYPAVMMMTGENDPRVDPYNSRKMAAALQTDTASSHPVLLIQRSGRGHGIGGAYDEMVEDEAEQLAFFQSQLK
jgi:prolyl oligopeptidase